MENSAVKIAELEKEKIELERALKDSGRTKLDTENKKAVIEETRIPDKRKFNAVFAQLEAGKTETDAIDKGRVGEFFAYVALGALIVIAAVMASILSMRWKRAPLELLEPSSRKLSRYGCVSDFEIFPQSTIETQLDETIPSNPIFYRRIFLQA